MALYNDLEIYKDTLVLSKYLRQRIYKLTNKYYKFGIGEEICCLLRSIKFQICRINARCNDKKLPYLIELTEQLHHLTILIEECVEDGIFKLNGKGNIIYATKLLMKIKKQTTLWRKSVERCFEDKKEVI